MKVSREKAAANRAAVVTAAGRLFRERGFDGVTVAEVTRAAGLTHGGFYGQFGSKEQLMAEACAEAFVKSLTHLEAVVDGSLGLDAFVGGYLSELHRDRPGSRCPMAALATEVARQEPAVQARFAEGVSAFLDRFVDLLPAGLEEERRRRRAVAVLAALVGALALSRATAKADPALSSEILAAVRTELTGR